MSVLVIRGACDHFQSGADINWLYHVSRQGPDANYAASVTTVRFSRTLNEFPKPTIAVIEGACSGGGVCIACCVDVAVATPDARFGITEVRVGIAPTPISTFMVGVIGLLSRSAITDGSAAVLATGMSAFSPLRGRTHRGRSVERSV